MKSIHFTISDKFWEDFYRLYPGRGERTTVLRRVVVGLIEARSGFETEAEMVIKRMEENDE